MNKKMICFGVRGYEVPTFEKLAEEYGYELVLRPEYLNDSCVDLAVGYEMVMVRANCVLSEENYKMLAEHGLKYYMTRTAGYNHVNVEACKKYGIRTAFVPGYSPNAIAELALTLGMTLLRHVQYDCDRTKGGDFRITDEMFSKEIRSCTVGIIGCGRIGYTAAKLFHGLGARAIGYDMFPKENDEVLTYVDLETLLKESDLISIHMAYFAGSNDDFIGEKEIAQMKDGVVLVNTSRGEVLDMKAVIKALKDGKLGGFGCDVIKKEGRVFFKNFENLEEIPDEDVKELVALYPKALITPHVASATEGALRDMIEITLKNTNDFLETGECRNSLIK